MHTHLWSDAQAQQVHFKQCEKREKIVHGHKDTFRLSKISHQGSQKEKISHKKKSRATRDRKRVC